MSFHLEAHRLVFVKFDDSRVVAKNTHAPVIVPKPFPNFFRGTEDGFLQHISKMDVADGIAGYFLTVVNPSGQCLVRTVFAPCLSNRLKLDVGRLPSQRAKVFTDRLHFHETQVQLTLAAQSFQRLIIHMADRDRLQMKVVLTAHREVGQLQWTFQHIFDSIVSQNA